MATVKVKFRSSAKDGKEGTIFYKVTHRRVASQVSTKYKILSSEWDSMREAIVIPNDTLSERKDYLKRLREQIKYDTVSLQNIVNNFENAGMPYKANDVVSLFLEPSSSIGFIAYARQTVAKLRAMGKPVAANYNAALSSFIKFHGEEEIPFSQFDQDLMAAYECHLKDSVCRNSSSCYMRNLHAIYNRAVEDGYAPSDCNPFRHVYTGVDKTEKRAISLQLIKSIANADLKLRPALSFARDMFVFSFCTQGMSLVDMAYLKEDNIKDDILTYRRKKTGQTIHIKYVDEIKEIVCKYHGKCNGSYLLPLLSKTEKKEARDEYKKVSQRINRNVKKLGKLLGMPIKLTMYVARHSWATTAQSQHIPLATISRCLGHDNEQTTVIYLAGIETNETFKANDAVLQALKEGCSKDRKAIG